MSQFVQVGNFALAVGQISAVEFDRDADGECSVRVQMADERWYRFRAESDRAFRAWWEESADVFVCPLPPVEEREL